MDRLAIICNWILPLTRLGMAKNTDPGIDMYIQVESLFLPTNLQFVKRNHDLTRVDIQ